MPPLKGTVITVLPDIEQFKARGWSKENVAKWITGAGGRPLTKVTDETTHLVCSDKQYRQHAETLAERYTQPIKIVSPDWLEDALDHQRKPAEGSYLWAKVGKATKHAAEKARRALERADEDATRPQSTQGMVSDLFNESTEQFVDEGTRAKIAKDAEKQRKEDIEQARQEREEKEAEKRKRREEVKAVFAKGAKKARNEIFSENHHIYRDATGFAYEVLLTKVDLRQNRNERFALTLQIYESNAEPCTYAVNMQFKGTSKLASNNILAAIGCNYFTAFHSFKKAFKEKAGIEWDNRISFAVERAKREKRERGQATGSPEGTARGMLVDESRIEKDAKRSEEDNFTKQPFQYQPPLYGARGVLPEKEKSQFAEIGPPFQPDEGTGQKKDEIELWMSGANSDWTWPDVQNPSVHPQIPCNPFTSVTTPTAVRGDGITQQYTPNEFDRFMAGAAAAAAETNDDTEVAPTDTQAQDDFGLGENTDYPFDFDVAEPYRNAQETEAQEIDSFDQPPSTVPETQATEPDVGAISFLGPSMLGKRKSAPSSNESAAQEKQCMTTSRAHDLSKDTFVDAPEKEVEDGYSLLPGGVDAANSMPRGFLFGQESDAQLEDELMSQVPAAERIEID